MKQIGHSLFELSLLNQRSLKGLEIAFNELRSAQIDGIYQRQRHLVGFVVYDVPGKEIHRKLDWSFDLRVSEEGLFYPIEEREFQPIQVRTLDEGIREDQERKRADYERKYGNN